MNSSSEHDPLDALAEAFLERYRRGERPALTEYVRQYPELAEQIRELFPTLVAMEQCHPEVSEPARAGDRKIPEHLGEYRLLREVGRGGMGVVYEAVQESLGRHVALKVLPFNNLIDPRHLERFRREAKAAAQLHHTNIVPVFGVGEHQGIHFYAMQFIHGQGLDTVIREVKRLRDGGRTPLPGREVTRTNTAASVAESLQAGHFAADPALAAQAVTATHPHPEYSPSPIPAGVTPETGSHSELTAQPQGQYYLSVARLGVQAAEALEYAHRHGILHRDIKPGNLLLDTEGTVWVTDFGLAKAEGSEDLTHSGDLVGTLRYMAPERLRGEADARSDVYSLGLTLYELLTLRPAFDAADRGHVLDQIRHHEPTLPRKLDAQIPRDLETVVLKAMAKDCRQRYTTAEELADDLRQFLAVRPIRARRSSLAGRAWRWCRRNPVVAALSAGLVLVLTLGLAGVAWKWREADRRAGAEAAERLRAEQAEQDAVEALCDSYRDQARAGRLSRRPGQRFASLEAVRKAVQIVRERHLSANRLHELRNEALACLVLPDLRIAREWEGYPEGSLDVSCDERMERYARSDRQGNVSVRRLADDTPLYSLAGRGRGASPVLSPDGGSLAVWDDDASLRAWRLSGDQPILLFEVERDVPQFAFAFDAAGRRLAVGHGDGMTVYTLDASHPPRPLKLKKPAAYVAFHPSRPLLGVASGASVQVYDLNSGGVLADFSHPALVRSLAWHPQGSLLAVSCDDYRIHLWSWPDRKLARILEGLKNLGCMVGFNHSGSLLASMEWSGVLRLWDPQGGRQLFSMAAATTGAPRFSADDRLLGCSSEGTKLRTWHVADGREYRTLIPETSTYFGFDVSPIDGRLLAVPTDAGFRLWDLDRREPVGLLPSGVASFQFEQSGAVLSSGPTGLLRWPMRRHPDVPGLRFGPPEKLAGPARVLQVACSRDGGVVARAEGDGALVLHRRPPGPSLHLTPHPDARYVGVSPDGRWVATGSHHGTQVKVWHAEDGRLAKVLPIKNGSLAAFSPDGRWLATTGDGGRLWEVPTWREGPRFDPGVRQPFAFSPNGRLVAVETGRGVVRLVVADTGEEVARLEDPDADRAAWICFGPDAAFVITLGQSHALHIWDLRALRRELAALDLDWDWPPFPPPQAEPQGPLQVEVVTAENQ